MSVSRPKLDRLRPCLLPVLGLCFAYWLIFERPLAKNLSELTSRHRQLSQTATSQAPDAQRSATTLSDRLKTERELKDKLRELQQHGVQLVAERSQPAGHISSSPAGVMSRVFELLQAHELECLDSKVLSESQNPTAEAPDFHRSIAKLLGTSSTEKMKLREIRVTLRGRFEDVRSALKEMQVALACVYVVSLEMEPEVDGLHIWKLILLV